MIISPSNSNINSAWKFLIHIFENMASIHIFKLAVREYEIWFLHTVPTSPLIKKEISYCTRLVTVYNN